MSLENRVDRIEEAILTMKDLLVSHDERLEKYFFALNKTRQDFDFKINALIDSQIRNQDEIGERLYASGFLSGKPRRSVV